MNRHHNEKKKQKIQWDEETIALHDLERGSRQKIEEAPTPYRYHSESDQSESEGESLAANSADADTETVDNTDNNANLKDSFAKPKRIVHCKQPVVGTNTNTVSDSWETLNAKLQYEKYLQELKDKGMDSSSLNAPRRYLGESSTGSTELPPPYPPQSDDRRNVSMPIPEISTPMATPNQSSSAADESSVLVSSEQQQQQQPIPLPSGEDQPTPSIGMVVGLDEEHIVAADGQHDEHLNSAPAAWSPLFTRKHYRSGVSSKSSLRGKSTSEGEEEFHNKSASHKAPKSVCIKTHTDAVAPTQVAFRHNNNFLSGSTSNNNSNGNGASSGSGTGSSGSSSGSSTVYTNDQLFAGINGSIGGDDSSRKEQFRNKRAGHYNEFKVLQAMRAKLAAEEAEDEQQEEDTTASMVVAENQLNNVEADESSILEDQEKS